MRLSAISRLAAFLALIALPVASQAQVTVYTTLASFLAATSNAATDTFNELPFGAYGSPRGRFAGDYGYTVSSLGFSNTYATGTAADKWLSPGFATYSIDFSNFGSPGAPVRGIGGFFFGSNSSGLFAAGISIVVRAQSGGVWTTQTITNATTGSFLGFVSNAAFDLMTISALQPETGQAWATVNDLVLAQAGVTPPPNVVPEPSTYALMGTGLLGLGVFARRRGNTA